MVVDTYSFLRRIKIPHSIAQPFPVRTVQGKAKIVGFLSVKIMADVYDALTSKRPYKKPYALSEALEYLMGGSNVLFDSTVVNAFLKAVPVYPKGMQIELTNGEKAIVVKNTINPLRPIIRLFDSKQYVNLNTDLSYLGVTISPNTIVERNFQS